MKKNVWIKKSREHNVGVTHVMGQNGCGFVWENVGYTVEGGREDVVYMDAHTSKLHGAWCPITRSK